MSRPLVKICGITRVDDALVAVEAGADFIGFVFAESSPRYVEPAAARAIVDRARNVDAKIQCVGVFVDEDVAKVNAINDTVGLDLVQLHGREGTEVIDAIERPVIRALRVRDSLPDATPWAHAAWILYDTYSTAVEGGTGTTFDWSLLATAPTTLPFFLSGGINAGNVARAIATVRPAGIDVSSGVEDAAGVKSAKKIRALFDAIEEDER